VAVGPLHRNLRARGQAAVFPRRALDLEDGEEFLLDIDLHSMKYAEVYRGADALRHGSITRPRKR
jgi:hypothetical protein